MHESAGVAETLMRARQTVLPKRLGAPAPTPEQLAQIVASAAHAPDHGQLLPWRFVQVSNEARPALADAFAQALLERDAAATEEQLAQAREKAFRSPVLLLLVVDLGCGDREIDAAERLLSAGCAVQNMLLMATALGFGSALTSGKALHSTPLRNLFGLTSAQQAVCFVNIGTAIAIKPARVRPVPGAYFGVLEVRQLSSGPV